jgi:hypothetical protein
MTRELNSLGIGLRPGTRSMAYKHCTQCAQFQSRMGEQSVASGTWLRVSTIRILAGVGMAASWWATAAHTANYIYNGSLTMHWAAHPLNSGMPASQVLLTFAYGTAWHMCTCRSIKGRNPSMGKHKALHLSWLS